MRFHVSPWSAVNRARPRPPALRWVTEPNWPHAGSLALNSAAAGVHDRHEMDSSNASQRSAIVNILILFAGNTELRWVRGARRARSDFSSSAFENAAAVLRAHRFDSVDSYAGDRIRRLEPVDRIRRPTPVASSAGVTAPGVRQALLCLRLRRDFWAQSTEIPSSGSWK